MGYTIEKHEGLIRFYHAEVLIPMKQVRKYQPTDANLKSGKVFIKETGYGGERIKHSDYPVVWSKELDGKSIIILLTVYPKMTYEEIKMVLEAEGATIDKGGIIHAKSE